MSGEPRNRNIRLNPCNDTFFVCTGILSIGMYTLYYYMTTGFYLEK